MSNAKKQHDIWSLLADSIEKSCLGHHSPTGTLLQQLSEQIVNGEEMAANQTRQALTTTLPESEQASHAWTLVEATSRLARAFSCTDHLTAFEQGVELGELGYGSVAKNAARVLLQQEEDV